MLKHSDSVSGLALSYEVCYLHHTLQDMTVGAWDRFSYAPDEVL